MGGRMSGRPVRSLCSFAPPGGTVEGREETQDVKVPYPDTRCQAGYDAGQGGTRYVVGWVAWMS
jgi:hypothetical protein